MYPNGVFICERCCYPSPFRWSLLISSTIRSLILDLTCVAPPLQHCCFFFLLCSLLLFRPSCDASVAGLVLVLLVLALGRSPLASFVWLISVFWACCLVSACMFCKCFSSSARTRRLALLTFAMRCSISRSRVRIVFTFCWVREGRFCALSVLALPCRFPQVHHWPPYIPESHTGQIDISC